MAIESITDCDECQKQLVEGDNVYCSDCYSKLESRVCELEGEVGRLEARIAEQEEVL